MPRTTRGPARCLRDALRAVVLAFGALDDAERPCGTPLPAPHAWALLELLALGPLTVTALASRLSIDRTNVSRLCQRMEAAGDVRCEPHPEDRRARIVALTASGERAARAVEQASTAHFECVVAALDADPRGVIAALDALARALAPAHRPSARPRKPQPRIGETP
ncbi:MAG: MarR family transcriptional regulator [Polyangiaceae bacterium]